MCQEGDLSTATMDPGTLSVLMAGISLERRP